MQEPVHGMAARREQAASPSLFLGVPAILTVPRPNTVVIIYLTVMNLPDQPLVDHCPQRYEFAGKTALKAYAGLHPGLFYSRNHPVEVPFREAQWLLDNEMFAGPGGRNHLIGVLVWVTGHIDHVDRRILQHRLEIRVGLDAPPMSCANLIAIQESRGVDRGNLRLPGIVDCVDMGAGGPSITYDANVEFFHNDSGD